MNNSNTMSENGFLNGTSQAVKIIKSLQWENTPLGDPVNWPQSLRSALSICLNSNFPIAIYWGTDLVLLYNDAWSSIPGNKHPWAQGKPALEVWPEIWDAIQPQFEKAFSGEAGGSKDALLPMQRHGYTEECYFDFTFTPIYGESGKVEGIFNAVIETTYRVINERRSFLLQRLTDTINALTETVDVYLKSAEVLNNAKVDVPFFTIYEFGNEQTLIVCATSHEIETLYTKWPLEEVKSGKVIHIAQLSDYITHIPEVYWPEPPTEAILIPLKANDGKVHGCIAAGLSSRRKYDKEYKSFFESLGNIIGGELNTIASLDEQRKRAEALAEIDRSKTLFFSNISHEFRTPLTLMLGPLETVIESKENSSEQAENLQSALRNTLRLQKLVNTLLDFSRIESGRMEAKLQHVNIAELTRDLASSFTSAIESAGILYRVQIENFEESIVLDAEMWEKIVLNLLSNALKYTISGTIDIALRDEGKEVVLEIRDTGVGIKSEDQSRIFERFYRANTSGARSQEGTGIGLAMVKELVGLLKGNIRLTSEFGKGSSFKVTLPKSPNLVVNASDMQHVMKAPSSIRRSYIDEAYGWSGNRYNNLETKVSGVKGKILIADDNIDMLNYIHRLFSGNYEVLKVSNGEEAFQLALNEHPDLIISDIMMPGLDGFGLLKKLKTTFVTKSIPVVFLSARAGEEARIEGIKAGADDYLVKPFSAKELLARVENHILISRTRRIAEKEFFNLFLQAPAHIHVMKGPEHVVEFFHPLGRPFIGGRDITGQKIREAVPEVDGQGYFEMLDLVYHERKSFFLPEAKAIFSNEDGSIQEYYFNITYLPWCGLTGEIQGVLQFSFDVSEQVKSNLKIKESEERFKLLVTSIPQIVWIADNNSKIEYLSEQWQKYTGVNTDEGRAKFSSMIHEEDVKEVVSRWYTALQEGVPWRADFRLRNAVTNTYTWFSGHTLPLKDEEGKITKWIGSASDISSQKELHKNLSSLVTERTKELIELNKSLELKNSELAITENFLQTVLDSSVEMVTAFDKDLNYSFINKRALDYLEIQPGERIGRNIRDVNPNLHLSDLYDYLLRALNGEVIHLKARKPFEGKGSVFETFILPLRHNKSITGVLKLQRDVTAMVQLSEDLRRVNSDLQRSNEDLQQFAHVTSHDLKEPVRKIRTFAERLRISFPSAPEKAIVYLDKIDHSTSRISTMIDGILQYSSIDTEGQQLGKVDLNIIMTGIIHDLEIVIAEKRALVEISDMPTIYGASVLLNQLFYNLINNAFKFSKQDVAPYIKITSQLVTPSEKELDNDLTNRLPFYQIDITDNGIGFEQAYTDKIFEPFSRLNAKDKFEGTGIGLALCKKIVKRHQGFIKAKGKSGEGATFSVFLPVVS